MNRNDFLNINEMCRAVGVTRSRINYAMAQGYLPAPAIPLGGQTRVYFLKSQVSQFKEYFQERKCMAN